MAGSKFSLTLLNRALVFCFLFSPHISFFFISYSFEFAFNNVLCFSLADSAVVPAPDSQGGSDTGQKTESTVSLKVEAALSEVDVTVRFSQKNLAEMKVRGM